jgi:hypothetical protein
VLFYSLLEHTSTTRAILLITISKMAAQNDPFIKTFFEMLQKNTPYHRKQMAGGMVSLTY